MNRRRKIDKRSAWRCEATELDLDAIVIYLHHTTISLVDLRRLISRLCVIGVIFFANAP